MIKKIIYIILGSISLILGVIGIILPLLPTTPFILLALFFYFRSSEKLYNWVLNHKLFGSLVYNYVKHKTVSKKSKIFALLLLWSTIIVSTILIDQLIVYIVLPIIALLVSIHILHLKTSKND